MSLTMGDVLNVKAKDFPLADQAHWQELRRKRDEWTEVIEAADRAAARSELAFKEVK